MLAKESAEAKAKGIQDDSDMTLPDSTFFRMLYNKKKLTKRKAGYKLLEKRASHSCVKCKFNLGDEEKCHIVAGTINNEKGISALFSPKGDGMLPGDIVWMYVTKAPGKIRKLPRSEGHVISKGGEGYQCKDCKYYLYSRKCLLIQGKFRPEMSCGFIVKVGHGVEV